MGLGCTGTIAKLLLFVINFAVFACGAVLLGVGIYLVVDDEGISWITDITDGANMNDGLFKAAVYLMVVIGAVLFFIGFLGCCGAWKENTCMLSMYSCLVSVFLVVQIAAGVLAAVFSAEIDDDLAEALQRKALEYGKDDNLFNKAWDDMQIKWQCCGGEGYEDYFENTYLPGENLTIPKSCCAEAKKNGDDIEIDDSDLLECQTDASVGNVTSSNTFFTEGCYYSFKDWVDENTTIIMAVFFGLAALQLIGIVFACCVKGKISNSNKVA